MIGRTRPSPTNPGDTKMTLDKANLLSYIPQALAAMLCGFAYLCYAISPLPVVWAIWSITNCLDPNTCGAGAFLLFFTTPILIGGMLVGIISSIIAWILGSRDWFLFLVPLSCIIAIASLFGPNPFKNDWHYVLLMSILPTLFVVAILGRRMVSAILLALIQPRGPTLPPERYMPSVPPPQRS